ncbi:MAG TPA: tetratricopeptide repeat protein [Azospira sp.]|nr:tetratricopeptide repeat protein [Azospira sp.]
MVSHFSPSPRSPQRPKLLPALLLGAFLGLSVSGAALSAEASLPEVQKLVKQGQFPQALTQADAYIATHPKDAQGRFLKGLILTELNRGPEAIVVFTKLTEDYPELPEPYNNLAVLYAQQKQYDKARSALEMAIRTHPSYAVAHENLGDVYAKLASQAYDKALQLDSSNTAAQSKLSLIRELITTRPSGKPAATTAAPTTAAAPAAAPAPAPVPAAAPAKPTAEPAKVTVVESKSSAAAKPAVEKAAEPAKAEKNDKQPAPTAKSDGDEANVTKAVNAWASAWSRKDVKGYLSYYAPEFQVPGGASRKAWENERASRIDKPGKLQVAVSDITVNLNGDKATVRFKQHYTSASLKSSTGKTLVLIKSGSKWLIQQEKVGG